MTETVNARVLRSDLLMGGPGHEGYTYCADVYCVECGKEIINRIDLTGIADIYDEAIPQPIFFGESDCEQYCSNCGEYLYGSNV